MPNVAEIITKHVTLDVKCVDRLYLNGYVPRLQSEGGVVAFLRRVGGRGIPSPALFGGITEAFRTRLRAWAEARRVPWIEFKKEDGKKDDFVEKYRTRFPWPAGVVLVGVAQERASGWTASKTQQGRWVHFTFRRKAVCVNHYYIYVIDHEWGPAFIKVCSYAPYAIKVCLNGHEWAKRQLQRRGIPGIALDNGFLSCANPAALQAICDRLSAADIESFFRRWLTQLPLPLTAQDQAAGFGYQLSMLQVEVSRTQVFDRPLRGREFFEQVIRDNLDLGRPDRVQLLFGRRITRATPGRFHTRVITHGVVPSLHIEYKRCHIKHDTCALDISLGRRLSKERLLRAVSVRRDIDSEPGTAAFSGHHRLQSTGLDPMQDGPPAHPDRVGRVLRREPALRCRPRHYLPHGRPEPDAPGRPGRHLVADEQPVAQPAKHGEVADAELLRRLQGGVDRLRALRERGLVL